MPDHPSTSSSSSSADAGAPVTPELIAGATARLGVAIAAAGEVAEMARAVYQSPDLEIDRKPDGSVVTAIDRGGEERIRALVAEHFPADDILGEEFGGGGGEGPWRWVIDPIDGTRSFTLGIPSFCTLIGIEHADHPGMSLAGCASFPATGERLDAVHGGGATWTTLSGRTRPARVSAESNLGKATVELGAPSSFRRRGPAVEQRRRELVDAIHRTRGWDDGYAFALVATGRVDAAVQCGLSRWDISPFDVILREAGGRLTDWAGEPGLNGDGNVIAGPAGLVEGLSALLH